MTDNEKRPNLFDDDQLLGDNEPLDKLEQKDVHNEEKINESAENKTRSNKNENKKVKKEKVLYTPEQLEDLENQRKRKKRKRRLITLFLFLTFCISSVSVIYFLNNKIGKNEENKEILYSQYKEVFVDEEYTEIVKDLKQSKVDEITDLFNSIKDGTSKMQFKNWQETMTEQFKNQEKAKKSVEGLYDGSNMYIGENVTDAQIQETESALKLKFNSEYQNELLKEFETLKGQYNIMSESIKATNSLFNEKKQVNEFSQADLENIKSKIEKNPNTQLKNKQLTKYDSAYKQWEERENKRREEQERLDQEREEQERIAQEKALEEARRQAEYDAKVEAERERIRQEELRKQQEEQARLDEIQRKKDEEQRIKDEEEARKKAEQEQAQKEQEQQNNQTQESKKD